MQILTTIDALQTFCQQGARDTTLGLVPTMGALHAGHAALIQQAKEQADRVIVSVFVNPTQFDEATDYHQYPRTDEEDLQLLQSLAVEAVFMPTAEAMYPSGHDYLVDCQSAMAHCLEGAARPGHFCGMLTVVLKLLILVQADYAYFGAKDYQQAQLVKGLAHEFFIPTEIIVCDTVRQASGVPYSSRLRRLSAAQKRQVEQVYAAIGLSDYKDLDGLRATIESYGFVVEYLECLQERLFLAMRLGTVRLIDNFLTGIGEVV